jgi:hypothetical protein
VLSQFNRIEQYLRNHGQIRWTHAMHLIRLPLSGAEVLKNGFVHAQWMEADLADCTYGES